jgi:MFS family permease
VSASTTRTPFVALMTAYTISVLGTSMSALAIPWLVLTTTGSAGKTGLVAFAEMAPYVTALALAGPLVDRIGLRRAFVWGNVIAALAVGAIPVMSVVGGLSLGVLVGLVAAGGLVRGAADCANSALVPTTAAAGGIPLERAAGLNAGANRTAMLLGAPLAGVLVTLTGTATVVAIDAVTFAVGAAIVAVGMRGVGDPLAEKAASEAGALRRYGRDLAVGFRFIRGDRLLLGLIATIAVTNLLDQGFFGVMVPVWVRHNIGAASALGILGAASGLGSVLGNLIGAWLGTRLPRRATFAVGFLLGGAPMLAVLALSRTVWPVMIVFLLTSFFSGFVNPIIGAVSFERIPTELRARVLGAFRASAWVGIPFGALLGGYAVEALGLDRAVWAFGIAFFLTTLAPFVFPAWRQMRRPTPTDQHLGQPVPVGA